MSRLTDKTELAEIPADTDLLMVVDASDTTGSSAGTSKKISILNAIKNKITDWLGVSASGDTVTFTGSVHGLKCGVLTFLNTPADVIVATPGTFVAISGTYTQPVIENFTDLNPGMQYDGTVTQHFKIDWHAQVEAVSANTTFSAASSLNGVVNTDSVMSHFLKNAGQSYTLSGTWVTELSTGDILGASVTADIAQTLTINAVQITVSEFFD